MVTSMMSHLPIEIITEILSRLPVKCLLRFLCISKSWYALIKHPDFIKLHLHRSIETNRDRTLIFGKTYKACRSYSAVPRYFVFVHFPPENHFDKGLKLLVCLVAFDLATEKFRVFKTPVQQKIDLETGLEVLKGQLYFIELTNEYNDVWLMKEYGEASSWTQIYKMDPF